MQTSTNPRPCPQTLARLAKAQQQQLLPQYIQFLSQYHHRFDQEKIRQVKKVYQHGICGRNERGYTVVVDRIGKIKLQNLSKVLDEDQLVQYFNQRMCHLAQEVTRDKQQVVWIVDLGGKIMQLASKKNMEVLNNVVDNAVKYFPQMLYRLIFVNTPMLFDTIWTKLTHKIPKNTMDKVVMLGEELQDLYQFASPQILPEFLGGAVDEQTFLFGAKDTKQEEQSSDEEVDFSLLKSALGGLKLSGGMGVPSSNLKSVLQTPLNTEADK